MKKILSLMIATLIMAVGYGIWTQTYRYDSDKAHTVFGATSPCSTDTSGVFISLTMKADPIAYIYLQPYGDFTVEEAHALKAQIAEGLAKVYGGDWTHIKVLSPKPLPEKAYYKPRNRYLANELLNDISTLPWQKFVIGLTHEDISYKIHGQENYGIMGLAHVGSNKSIVSDYRLKGSEFIAVIVHEFGHGYYKAHHCTDPNCIMCDYQYHKGKPHRYHLCKKHEYMMQQTENDL